MELPLRVPRGEALTSAVLDGRGIMDWIAAQIAGRRNRHGLGSFDRTTSALQTNSTAMSSSPMGRGNPGRTTLDTGLIMSALFTNAAHGAISASLNVYGVQLDAAIETAPSCRVVVIRRRGLGRVKIETGRPVGLLVDLPKEKFGQPVQSADRRMD